MVTLTPNVTHIVFIIRLDRINRSAGLQRGWRSMGSSRKLIDADLFFIIESPTFNIRTPHPAWLAGHSVYQLNNIV
jgi:hypothetical protein